MRAWPLILLGCLWLCGVPLQAHPAHSTALSLAVDADGRFEGRLSCDLFYYALEEEFGRPVTREELGEALAAANAHLKGELILQTDNGPVVVEEWRLPALADFNGLSPQMASVEKIRFSGHFPQDAGTVTVRLPYALGDVTFVYMMADGRSGAELLAAGMPSSPVTLTAGGAQPGRIASFAQYVKIGFLHILPMGLDHILFVLGLFLMNTHWRPLLLQASAFTVAHSLTLALSLFGIVNLPDRLVESAIAASIAIVALENIRGSQLRAWRLVVVFLFGLVHGLGFAGAISEWGLPKGRFIGALVGFNVGIEVGQIAVIAGAFLAVGWWRHHAGYRRWVTVPASVLIAGVGGIWTVQRLFW